MKIMPAKPFTFQRGNRAVLLLHGFTGNSADVRMLGRFLEKHGYTCHAPVYRGHGVEPEELLKYNADDWWQDALQAYNEMKEMGYDEIAVAGLSLGGVFSLKMGYSMPVKGIVPMCAPMHLKSENALYHGVLAFARDYKKKEGKTPEQIEKEMVALDSPELKQVLTANNKLLGEVRENIELIYAPIFVVQARIDQMINTESANIIYNTVESTEKTIKWYEDSHHVITMDKEKDMLHEDILQFLNSLNWKE